MITIDVSAYAHAMMMLRLAVAILPAAIVTTFAFAPGLQQKFQEPPPAGAVPQADRGDRHFSPDWHAGRRKALLENIRKRQAAARKPKGDGAAESAESQAAPKAGIVVLRGAPGRRDYQKFRQTNEFFYLTGVEAPGAILVMHIESGREVLFLAPPSFGEAIFDDIRPHAPKKAKPADENSNNNNPNGRRRQNRSSVAQAEGEILATTLGFSEMREATEFEDYLSDAVAEGPIYTLTTPEEYEATSRDDADIYEKAQAAEKFDGRLSRTQQFKKKLEEIFNAKVKDLTPALDALRRIKTPEEIEAMRNAAKIAAAGHIAAMRATKPGLKEWQIGAEATAAFYRMGAPSISYFPIVGTGKNALILHYTDIGATIAKDDVILMDYAPEWRYYASDVTRSWPASGKFTEKGRKIYEAVLKAQEAAIAKVKAGVSFMEVNEAAAQVLQAEGFPPDKYMPHGLSHTIGMSTHDVGSLMTLDEGLVFTIEPGVYDSESGIGVRIEDVIAVTKDGYDNLSKDAPKTVAEIEAIVGKARH